MKLLPVEIFSIIQEHIGNDKDYRMLMNCNQNIFQSIKYQTIYFMVKIKAFLQSNEEIQAKFNNFQTLISRVKDKSKQIGLSLDGTTPELLMSHAHTFRQIHQLNHFRGISTINSGFENVRILSISHAYNLKTVDLRIVELTKFSINNCPKFSALHGINSVRSLKIETVRPNLEGFQLIPNVPYESISIFSYSGNLTLDMFYHCDLSHLQSLSLCDLCNIGDLSILMNIQHLSLGASKTIGRTNFPSLPIFNGRSLELVRFNLERWKSPDCIPNVKRIKIMDCTNVDPQLSFLSNVRVVSINSIDEISRFISLAYGTELELHSMKSLKSIAYQPRLRDLKIADCPIISDYGIDGQFLNRVIISKCPNFSPLNTFRNTREFILHANHSFNSSGLDRSDLSSTDRIMRMAINPVLVSSFPATLNYSALANIHLFDLTIHGELGELSHLHDIHTVQISNSYGRIEEIVDFRNIQILQFLELNNIRTLHHLENIEKVMLCLFPPDFQFDALKGCRIVYSRGNQKLEQQAELYSRGERDASLFESNELFGYVFKYRGVLCRSL